MIIRPSTLDDVDRLLPITERFWPGELHQDYVTATLTATTLAINECWHSAMHRVCLLDRRVVGYVSCVAVDHAFWKKALEGVYVHKPFPDGISWLDERSLSANNKAGGSYLWIPDFVWDISQDASVQVEVVKRLSDHILRYFTGNRISGYCVHTLPKYKPVADRFQLAELSNLGELGHMVGAHGERNFRTIHEPSVSDRLLSSPETHSGTLSNSDFKWLGTDKDRKLARIFYEYQWDKQLISAALNWPRGKHGRYYEWCRRIKSAFDVSDAQAFIEENPSRLCLGYSR